MLFGHHVVDKTLDEHLREIAALAADQQTLVVLDTNILTYLYKLHEAARQEFFRWSDNVAAAHRLIIPAWAASEYVSRVTSRTLDTYTPKSKEASQATRLLQGLLETASLFVDEAALRRIEFAGDRNAFLADIRAKIEALAPLTRVFSQDFDAGVIHQQIDAHLSPHILDSDLGTLCARATRDGPGRFEHRLPPGYRDGNKPENKLGDLIIWFEILEESARRAQTFSKVLFITNDEKNDWVYAPMMRKEVVRGTRKSVGNFQPQVKLADPRLVAEFRRSTGHTNVTIASLGVLVEGLSKTEPASFAHLAAAIQINIEQASPPVAGTPQAEQPQPEPDQQAPAEPQPQVPAQPPDVPVQPQAPDPALRQVGEMVPELPPPRLQYDQEALQDRDYPVDAPGAINEIIRALKSLNWYTQNPAIARIRSLREEETVPASSWFVLGRNIYQSACGNSQKAMEFMTALESRLHALPDAARHHLLAGMLFEVYFNAQGEFRAEAKFSYADKLLSVVTQDEYADVLAFITHHLRPHRDRLKYFPGDQGRLAIHIATVPVPPGYANASLILTPLQPPPSLEVQSIVLDGTELLRDVDPNNEYDTHLYLGRNRVSPESIKERIAEDLAIPKWALMLAPEPQIRSDAELAVPDGKVFDPKLVHVQR